MDHLEEMKTKIRDRLKKIDQIDKDQKNINRSSNQYALLIAERLKNIERIKTEILNNNSMNIRKSKESSIPIPQTINPPVQPLPPPPLISPDKQHAAIEAVKNSPSIKMSQQRSQQRQERERRMKSSASSGCGCTKRGK